MTGNAWVLPIAACAAVAALTPAVRAYALRRGLVDRPGPRRSHDRPVPRGGGLAIALVLACAVAWLRPAAELWILLVTSLAVAALGWREDHSPIPVRLRLAIEFALAVLVVVVLGPVATIDVAGRPVGPLWLWSPLAVIAVVWMTNLFNFMDGSDGLAAGQAFISAALFTAVFTLAGERGYANYAALVASATLGFVFWNRPRASIFLGDTGSLMLGWCMGLLALVGVVSGAASPWLAFIIVSPFVVDATLTLARRVMRGERWYTPHRDHAYQRLIRAGWSHRRVLLLWIVVNILLVVPAAALVLDRPDFDVAVAGIVALVLTGGWYFVHSVVAKERMTR
jgi:Fuc2NAc and GlcNAc transferase